MKWTSVSELIVAVAPVFMGAGIAFSVWVTSELYAQKYTSLDAEDGRRLTATAADYVDTKMDPVMVELFRIRDRQESQSAVLAETLTEVRLIRQQLEK